MEGEPEKRTFRFTRQNASFYFFGTLRFTDYKKSTEKTSKTIIVMQPERLCTGLHSEQIRDVTKRELFK